MTHSYNISGMTCNGCVAKAKNALLKIGDITEANIQLVAPQATLTMQRHVSTTELQNALSQAGNYTINEVTPDHLEQPEAEATSVAVYKPLMLIAAYILGVSLLPELVKGNFNLGNWMNNFMAGFFLTFSFFKLLDLKGFADSYSTYDIVARRWHTWGFIYAFVELFLGVAYLIRFSPILTNTLTLIVMSVSLIGVLQSVLNKRKIRCACLGAVFNLPMSTVTIIEDGLMITMSLFMLIATRGMIS
jgi:copper chaperone CopZ